MKKYILSALLIAAPFLAETLSAQQDPQFSQYMFAPLSINPAYAGSRGIMNGSLAARKQWVGFDGAPSTIAFAVNTPTRKGKVGLGLEVLADQIGPKNTTGFYFDYAYRFPLGKGKLAFGLGAGVVSYTVKWDEIDYKDNTDGYALLGKTTITKPDFKFGFFFNNKNFYIGGSTTHINREVYQVVANDSISLTARMSQHGFLTFGRAFQITDKIIFSPSLMFRTSSGIRQGNMDLNFNFCYREMIWFGVSMRSEKSVVALVQYNITNRFKLGYSYDLNIGRLKTYQSGSHELVLGFDLNLFQSQVLSPRYF